MCRQSPGVLLGVEADNSGSLAFTKNSGNRHTRHRHALVLRNFLDAVRDSFVNHSLLSNKTQVTQRRSRPPEPSQELAAIMHKCIEMWWHNVMMEADTQMLTCVGGLYCFKKTALA